LIDCGTGLPGAITAVKKDEMIIIASGCSVLTVRAGHSKKKS